MRQKLIPILIFSLLIAGTASANVKVGCNDRVDGFLQTDSCLPTFIDSNLSSKTDLQNYIYTDLADRFQDIRDRRIDYYQKTMDKRRSVKYALGKIAVIESLNQQKTKYEAREQAVKKAEEMVSDNMRHQYAWHNKKVEAVKKIYDAVEQKPDLKRSDVFTYNFTGNTAGDEVKFSVKTESKELQDGEKVEIKTLWLKDLDETTGTGTYEFPVNRTRRIGFRPQNKLGSSERTIIQVKNPLGTTKPLYRLTYDWGVYEVRNRDFESLADDIYSIYSSNQIDLDRLTNPVKALEKVSRQLEENGFYEAKAFEVAYRNGEYMFTNWDKAVKISHNGTTATGQLFTNQETNISSNQNYSASCRYYCNYPVLVADITDDNTSNPEIWELDGNYTVEKITDKQTGNKKENVTLETKLTLYSQSGSSIDQQITTHEEVLNKIISNNLGIGNPITGGFFKSIPGLDLISDFLSWIKEVIPLV